jgi:glycosyltransferase involved in cell wall biosynthesis
MDKKLTIAHIVCRFLPYRCGMGNAAYEEVKRLAENHEVVVFSLSNKKDSLSATQPKENFKIIWLKPLIRFGNAGFSLSLLWQLRNFDIIQLHYPFFGAQEVIWLGKILGILRKPKLIIYYHMDARLDNWLSKILTLPNEIINGSLFKQAKKIICSTFDYVENSSIKEIYRQNKEKFAEMPFGGKMESDSGKDEPWNKMKDKLGIKIGEKIILTVANLDRAHYFKGIDILIQAFKKVSQEVEKAKLIVIGDGELRKQYEEQARQLQIADKIIFIGRVTDEELRGYYGWCELYICAAINNSEAFSMAIVEAKSLGKAVVGSDLPGVRRVVGEGISGLLAKPGEAEDLAEKIKILLTDDELRKKFGQEGLRQARIIYNWDNHAKKLLDIYQMVVDE